MLLDTGEYKPVTFSTDVDHGGLDRGSILVNIHLGFFYLEIFYISLGFRIIILGQGVYFNSLN